MRLQAPTKALTLTPPRGNGESLAAALTDSEVDDGSDEADVDTDDDDDEDADADEDEDDDEDEDEDEDAEEDVDADDDNDADEEANIHAEVGCGRMEEWNGREMTYHVRTYARRGRRSRRSQCSESCVHGERKLSVVLEPLLIGR